MENWKIPDQDRLIMIADNGDRKGPSVKTFAPRDPFNHRIENSYAFRKRVWLPAQYSDRSQVRLGS